ncbi:MAG: putative pyruvate formate lyase activating enzyme [Candidatus Poribacteria bacterium]|nr:putative pyruvate formate lyase activating enzyme [Candidatus Poribacteria bacterium]
MPKYRNLFETGELERRVSETHEMLKECKLCARECGVNRLDGEKGFCKSGKLAMVSSIGPHFGEEPPLVGRLGSGTIFFTNCNLGCVFCQNYDISQLGDGKEIDSSYLARAMLSLQSVGCHNINFVTPTHYVPQILDALLIAVKDGLNVPLVYNCGGYESLRTLKLLDGVFDIYMPDIKYGDNDAAEKYSKAPNYFDVVTSAVSEMHRQVSDLTINERGIAERGLLVRHLVLPNDLAGTKKVIEYVSRLSKNTYLNIMAQYRPQYKASKYPELNRRITSEEYENVLLLAEKAELTRGFSHDR